MDPLQELRAAAYRAGRKFVQSPAPPRELPPSAVLCL